MILDFDTGEAQDISLGVTGLDDIRQCLHTLMGTIKGTVFLDRELGVDGNIIDMPINRLGPIFDAVDKAVEEYEPRVDIVSIKPYKSTIDGQIQLKIKFKIKEGVL